MTIQSPEDEEYRILHVHRRLWWEDAQMYTLGAMTGFIAACVILSIFTHFLSP